MAELDPRTGEDLQGPFAPYLPPIENNFVLGASLAFVPSLLMFLNGLAGAVRMRVENHAAIMEYNTDHMSGADWGMLIAALVFLIVGIFLMVSASTVDKARAKNARSSAVKAAGFVKMIGRVAWIPAALLLVFTFGRALGELSHEADGHAVEATKKEKAAAMKILEEKKAAAAAQTVETTDSNKEVPKAAEAKEAK